MPDTPAAEAAHKAFWLVTVGQTSDQMLDRALAAAAPALRAQGAAAERERIRTGLLDHVRYLDTTSGEHLEAVTYRDLADLLDGGTDGQ